MKVYCGNAEWVYVIHEAYYNKRGQIWGWSTDPMHPQGETLQELKNDLKHIALAFKKPILNMATLKPEGKPDWESKRKEAK